MTYDKEDMLEALQEGRAPIGSEAWEEENRALNKRRIDAAMEHTEIPDRSAEILSEIIEENQPHPLTLEIIEKVGKRPTPDAVHAAARKTAENISNEEIQLVAEQLVEFISLLN